MAEYLKSLLTNAAGALMHLANEWPIWLPLLVGALAIFLLLPRPRPYPWYAGALAGGLALFLAAGLLLRTTGLSAEVVLFYAFSGIAVLGAAVLVTQHNPARAALSFTVVVLATCGLFLLLAAPFLMAATIIIYAGAIIVTFLFVLMLAQQAGLSDADARSREPVFATLTGFLLLATMLYVLKGPSTRVLDDLVQRARLAAAAESRKDMEAHVERPQEERQLFKQADTLLLACGLRDLAKEARHAGDEWIFAGPIPDGDEKESLERSKAALQKLLDVLENKHHQRIRERMITARLPSADEDADALAGRKVALSNHSGPPPGTKDIRRDDDGRPALPAENSAYLGRSLFTDYLLPVEIGGLLLLAATVGAIAIAQRRES